MPDWFEDFFSGSWLSVHGLIRGTEQTRAEVDFVQGLGATRILDVPCGDGRVGIELAATGHDVTGVDRSRPLLERAEQHAQRRGVRLRLEQRDMRDLPWNNEFDAAINLWGSFGYFDDRGDQTFSKSVAGALRRGGAFVIEAHVAETLYPKFKERSVARVADILLIEERQFDVNSRRVDVKWTLVQDKRADELHSSIRIYGYRELLDLLRSAGFSSFESYSSFAKQPFGLGSPRLVLVART